MLRCVIFDLDNTLVDSPLDFAAIKAEIGADAPILEHRETVGPEEQRRIDEILDRHETHAAARSDLFDGATELLAFLKKRSVRTALLAPVVRDVAFMLQEKRFFPEEADGKQVA